MLEQLAHERACAWVALGHTADDQAETVLMRILRGSGPAGLGAMRSRRGIFVRPLLEVSRREVMSCLAAARLEPLQDPSNASDRFLRNRVRRQLLPLLTRENPRIVSALCRLAASCQVEDDALAAAARVELERARLGGGLDGARVGALPAGLRRRVLRLAFAEATGSTRRLERQHLLALDRALAGGRGVDLPGARAEVEGGVLRLRTCAPDAPGAAPLTLTLAGPGRYPLPDGRVLVVATTARAAAPEATMNAARVPFPLTVRTARAGDRIAIGPGRSRKVARVLMDAKIPRRERAQVPLLVSDDGRILLIVGIRRAYGLRVDPGERALHVRVGPAEAAPLNDSPLASPC